MADLIVEADLIANYLSGVKLTDQNGVALPDSLFDTAIINAVAWFSMTHKVFIAPEIIEDEQHDYYVEQYQDYCYIALYHYPVLSVQSVQAIYPTGQSIMIFPQPWVKLRKKAGQIQLIPTAGTLSQVLIGQGGNWLPLMGRLNSLPSLFHVSYTAGFDTGKVPDIVNAIIGMKAAIHVMNNSTVLNPGIQSQSIGEDGLSQTMSVMGGKYGPYSGRINSYNEQIQELVNTLMAEYRGIPFTVI